MCFRPLSHLSINEHGNRDSDFSAISFLKNRLPVQIVPLQDWYYMLRKEENNITWLEFELFAPIKNLTHRLYLKHGGFSENEFCSLNFSYQVGDSSKNVDSNIDKVKRQLNDTPLYKAQLEHGANVAVVHGINHKIKNKFDGMITEKVDLGLLITHADCQAAIFYDPKEHVVANIHCGWRGNVLNIYNTTIKKMKKIFGSKPENLLVGISPSLGPKHAEFIHYQKEFPKNFWDYQEKKEHFNLWEISRDQLLKAGVLPHHIEIAEICTYENSSDFFSYRRDKRCGRLGTIVKIT